MRTNLFPNPRNYAPDSAQSWEQWSSIGTAPTIANSTAQWLSPVQSSVLVTWANPTGVAGSNVGATLNGLTPGATYTASVWVYVPTGSVAVQLNAYFLASGSTSSTNNQWQQLSVTFTASSSSQFVGVVNTAAVAAAGNEVFLAAPLVELGTTVGSYFDGGYLSAFWNADGTSVSTAQAPQRINHCLNPVPVSTQRYGVGYGPSGAGTIVVDDSTYKVGSSSLKQTWTTSATSYSGTYIYWTGQYDFAGMKPGETYTAAMWYMPSKDTTVILEVQALDHTGVDLAANAGPAIACPANEWTLVYNTATAPSGTAYLRPLIYTQTVMLAGDFVHYNGMLLEESATLGDYFDYNSANSAQVGSTNVAFLGGGLSPYSCSMSQSVPSLNPNLPELQVEAWPTRHPYGAAAPMPMNGSSATSTTPLIAPMVLSDRVTQASTSRGRQYELDTDQTGSLKLKLDDSDGAVSSLLKPYNNVKVTAFWQGVAYDLWTGFTSVVPSQSVNARNAWSNLVGVDGLDVLANRALRAIQQEAILADGPEVFFPLNDAVGSQSATDLTRNGLPGSSQTAPITHYVYDTSGALGPGDCTSTFGAQTIATNGDTAWTTGNFMVADGAYRGACQVQVCGPDNPTGYELDLTQPWAVEITASASIPSGPNAGTSPYGYLFSMHHLDDYGGEWVGCEILPYVDGNGVASKTMCQVALWAGPTNYVYSQEIPVATVEAGLHVVVTYDGNGTHTLIVNGAVTPFTASVSSYGYGVTQWIGIGSSYDYGVIHLAVQDPANIVTLQNFAIYGSQLGVPDDSVWYDHYLAFKAYPNEYSAQRVARVLKWSGVSDMQAWSDNADYSRLAAMQDTNGASAVSVIQTACQSVLSRLIANEHGNPLYQDRYHGLLDASPVAVFGSDESAGEIPYTGLPTIAADPQHLFNDVTITQDSGATRRYVDEDSMAQYFQRVLQVSSSVYAYADSSSMASYLVGRYSDPVVRVTTLTVDLAANPNITAQVLALQVGHHVQLNHRTTAGVVSLDLNVDQISYSISAESWLVSFELTPLFRYWVAAAGRAQLTAAVPVGATSATIGPMQDAAWNPVEASIAVGSAMVLSPDTPNAEALAVVSVTSNTPGSAGYSSATVAFGEPTTRAHAVGDYLCDAPPSVTVEQGFGGSIPTTLVKLQTPGGFVNQSFFYDAATNQYYGANAKGGSLTTGQDMLVSRYDASGNLLDTATCTAGGHGASITVEYINGDPWIWFQWGIEDQPLVKWKYRPGTVPLSEATPVADFGTGTGRVTMFNIDQANDFIGVYTYIETQHTETFDLRHLSDYNAGIDNLLSTVTMTSGDQLGSFQGFCIDANRYLYVARGGDLPNSTAALYRYRWGAGDVIDAQLDTSKVPAATGTQGPGASYAEGEGVQMLRDSSGTNVIFGVTTNSTPGQRWNWVYKVNIPQNATPSTALQFDPTEWDTLSMVDSTTIPQW